ncbi:MAG: proline racemase family protein [Marinosulfonomonas sp.]
MHVVDSHTGGEPTRVILSGGPDLGAGTLAEQAKILATEHWGFCQSVLLEPRGQPAMVAALLVAPTDPNCAAGVIYFDADAVLGMCGHGTIGLTVTLAHLGRIAPGEHQIETPVGVVKAHLHDANTVTVQNIESRRVRQDVTVHLDGLGPITGDVAYGGNWFFIVDPSPVPVHPQNIPALTTAAIALREEANAQDANGPDGPPVDHVIFQGASDTPGMHSRNFVLCPDNTYDRSPCGTGSSARLACLAAEGRLAPGQEIEQESVISSSYRLSYQPGPTGGIIPFITGQAHISADTTLIFQDGDPFKNGITL